jgi:hypothetical protein
MSALAVTELSAAAEAHRRSLLAESDDLLERVEQLRLAGQRLCPADLADAVRRLQLRLGRVDGGPPRTVRTAHGLIFAIQARLMAANPRSPRPRSHPERPPGVPRISVLRQGGAWKFLALPPPPAAAGPAADAEWRDLVGLTVERALERWTCAQDRAVSAARERQGAVHAVHRARAAWRNYWELRCEAERLLGGSRARPLSPPRTPLGGSRGGQSSCCT